MIDHASKIVLTGAAGLVGQNLVVELKAQGWKRLVAIDKHANNLRILKNLHPEVETVLADLSEPGDWTGHFREAGCVIQLHAQITGKRREEFVRNNQTATGHVLDTCRMHCVPFLVHISSSVVNSKTDDDYTRTKKAQEAQVRQSGLRHCILRPTLMFGWFDPKHLGWLSRFMERSPIFPIPGDGRFMRQPLYERDFCRCVAECLRREPNGAIYDIVGETRIDYVDIIRSIRRIKGLHTVLVHIPISLFALLLRVYALFSRKPPFTADQLKALCAGDDFRGVNTQKVFGVKQTPFEEAIRESYCDPTYSHVVLER